MNYSENTTYGRKVVKDSAKVKKKETVFKKILISWLVCLMVGLIVGFFIGHAFNSKPVEQQKAAQADLQMYGTVSGQVFTSSIDWSNGAELGFVPLDCGMDKDLQDFIYCLSYGYGIDYTLVMGLIEQESSFDSNNISKTNDYGLMQINTINHKWLKETLGITDFLDPYQNTRAGVYILRNLFDKYQDTAKVLMAYNLGETNAKKLWDKGIYETGYTKKVMEKAQTFNDQIERMNEND